MPASAAHRRPISIARALTVAAVVGLHAGVLLMLGLPQHIAKPRAELPPLTIIMIERFTTATVPASGPPSPTQAPRLFTPPVDLSTAITLPDLIPGAAPTDPGLAALGAYLHCTLPEERDKRECARLRAQLRGELAPQPQSESDRIMMARIDREMARRNARTGVPSIGISRSGLPSTASPAWNDQHFQWK